MPRAVIITLVSSLAAATGALAQPIRIAPDPCPLPADIAPLVSEDVGADDLNPWADRFVDPYLFRDIPVAGGALIMRLYPDPVTGEIVEPLPEPLECADEPGWTE